MQRLDAIPDHVVAAEALVRVELAAANYDTAPRVNGKPSVGMAVFLQSGANALAERVRLAVQNTQFRIGRVALRVTISAGCASLSGCPSQAKEDLLAQVDERLYRAKHDGRNRVVATAA